MLLNISYYKCLRIYIWLQLMAYIISKQTRRVDETILTLIEEQPFLLFFHPCFKVCAFEHRIMRFKQYVYELWKKIKIKLCILQGCWTWHELSIIINLLFCTFFPYHFFPKQIFMHLFLISYSVKYMYFIFNFKR